MPRTIAGRVSKTTDAQHQAIATDALGAGSVVLRPAIRQAQALGTPLVAGTLRTVEGSVHRGAAPRTIATMACAYAIAEASTVMPPTCGAFGLTSAAALTSRLASLTPCAQRPTD